MMSTFVHFSSLLVHSFDFLINLFFKFKDKCGYGYTRDVYEPENNYFRDSNKVNCPSSVGFSDVYFFRDSITSTITNAERVIATNPAGANNEIK
jgi:hypothetical protein